MAGGCPWVVPTPPTGVSHASRRLPVFLRQQFSAARKLPSRHLTARRVYELATPAPAPTGCVLREQAVVGGPLYTVAWHGVAHHVCSHALC